MNKDIIALIGLFIIILLVWIFAIYNPQSDTKKELNSKIEVFREMERQQVPQSRIILMEEKLDSIEMKISDIKAHYYLDKAILDLGRHIEQIGEEYGLEFMSISLLNYEILSFFSNQNNQTLTELPIQVIFQGEYEELANFLDGIDEFPFLIRFTDILIINNFLNKKLSIILEGRVVVTKSEIGEKKETIKEAINENI
ncbi:MAG: type 4a pilus biogenesis protein PilO [bacterium]